MTTTPLTTCDKMLKEMAEPLQEFSKDELITMMVAMELENKKLKEDVKTLTNKSETKIKNVDSRCSVFDVTTNISYILEIIDSAGGVDGQGCEYEGDKEEKFNFACEEIAEAIDGAINMNHRGCHMTLNEHIFEEATDKAREMIDDGLIKEKEDEDEDEE
tara:strand:+ start:1079 stop:1558 length:480 start_codon:yes stop_codon:yes gene_type:complete